jgi:hypothetical protein
MEKHLWTVPQLIRLVRGSPGERVLDACKTGTQVGGSQDQANGCALLPTVPAAPGLRACAECYSIVTS